MLLFAVASFWELLFAVASFWMRLLETIDVWTEFLISEEIVSNENGSEPGTHLPVPTQPISGFVYGLAFLIATILSSAGGAYLAFRGTVDKYIDSNKEIKIAEINSRVKEYVKHDIELYKMYAELSELRARFGTPLPMPTPTAQSSVETVSQK
jgi:hypothetical protein